MLKFATPQDAALFAERLELMRPKTAQEALNKCDNCAQHPSCNKKTFVLAFVDKQAGNAFACATYQPKY